MTKQTRNGTAIECTRCGVDLGRRVRKGTTVCRVCAARSSYAYLEAVLSAPRKRRAA